MVRPALVTSGVGLAGLALLGSGLVIMAPYLAPGLFVSCGAIYAAPGCVGNPSSCGSPPLPQACITGGFLFSLGLALAAVGAPLAGVLTFVRASHRGAQPTRPGTV